MKISNQKNWDKWKKGNTDPYGGAVIEFAEKWADLMETRMAAGDKLEDIAKETSHEADEDIGITGFMYGAAVSVLATSWEHGDQLRRWHNLDTQIRDEGERANEKGMVLNLALLVIGE